MVYYKKAWCDKQVKKKIIKLSCGLLRLCARIKIINKEGQGDLTIITSFSFGHSCQRLCHHPNEDPK
jgi:hypothetical protein